MLDERKVAAMELVNYMKGSLWWGREYLLRRSPQWHSNRYAHPLMSVCSEKITTASKTVPMLVGSSTCYGKKDIPVKMEENKSKITYFNVRIRPIIYVDDFFASGVPLEPDVCFEPRLLKKRSLELNFPKTHVNEDEMQDVERFIKRSRRFVKEGGMQ